MMRTMVKRAISIFGVSELLILSFTLFSQAAFANVQVAFLSAFFVIVGSSYAYKRMVNTKVSSQEEALSPERELLDTIEDPHELYDEEPLNEAPAEELDLKAIVKEEKAKIKTFSFKSMKHGARGSVSLFRIVPYIFLILGFIALKNNEILLLSFYLPALLGGIVVGSLLSRDIAA